MEHPNYFGVCVEAHPAIPTEQKVLTESHSLYSDCVLRLSACLNDSCSQLWNTPISPTLHPHRTKGTDRKPLSVFVLRVQAVSVLALFLKTVAEPLPSIQQLKAIFDELHARKEQWDDRGAVLVKFALPKNNISNLCQPAWNRSHSPWQTYLFRSTRLLKWNLGRFYMPSHTVSEWQHLLSCQRLQIKNKMHVVIVFQIQMRENCSLNFNSLVNQVSWQTRFGLATHIVHYDALNTLCAACLQ